jgi:hypothetical protein
MLLLFSHWHVLWFVRATLLVFLVCVVIKKDVHRDFPFFSSFIGWLAVCSTIMLWMDYSPLITSPEYNVGLIVEMIGETFLSFALLYELLRISLHDYPRLKNPGMSGFRWMVITLAAVGIALAWYIPVGSPWPLVPTQALVFRTIRTLECGLLLFVTAFNTYFRLPWRKYSLGITVGLSFYMGSSLAMNAIRSQIEPRTKGLTQSILAFSNETVYIVSVLIWLIYLLAAQPTSDPSDTNVPPHDLGAWNRELGRLSE